MISSINIYSQLYLAAQMTSKGPTGQAPAAPAKDQKAPAAGSCRREAEPGGAEADRLIGKEVTESHYQLSRVKVEDSLTTEQLEEVVKALAGTLPNPDPKGQPIKVPLNAVYNNSRSGRDDLWQRQPALKFLFERDQKAHNADCAKPAQGGHRHLYHYFGNPEYWNNAIVLLSLLAQKQIEANDRAGILRTTQYCRDYKVRIERQKSTQQFEPVEYYEAVLDLTEAELMAQVKGKLLTNSLARPGETELNPRLVGELRAYYTRAQRQVEKAINTLVSFKDKFFWPSEPDFFSIPKALILLGDLDVKLKEVNRQEIALLRRKDPHSSRIDELEKQNLELLEAAYTLYGALQQIDENMGSLSIKVNLPGLNLKEFTPDNIKDALASNAAKGFLEESDRLDALNGIFHLLKAVATMKRVSLLPQMTRSLLTSANPAVADAAGLRSGKVLLQGLKDCNQALADLQFLLTQMKGKLSHCTPARKLVLQERISKLENGFYFHFGRLVKADMTLAVMDRLNFTLIDNRQRPDWENFSAIVEALADTPQDKMGVFEPVDHDSHGRLLSPGEIGNGLKAELAKDPLNPARLDNLRYEFSRLIVASAEQKYARVKDEIARAKSPTPFYLKNLTAWAEVKLIEAAVRSASYVSDKGKNIGAASEYLRRADKLNDRWLEKKLVPPKLASLFDMNDQEHPGYVFFKAGAKKAGPEAVKLWERAETYFEEDEYLGIELDYLKTIFYSYRFSPDSGATAGDPAAISNLVSQIKKRADFLPREQKLHFTYNAELKEGIARIQNEDFEGATDLLDGGKKDTDYKGNLPGHFGGLLGRISGLQTADQEVLALDIHGMKAELYNELAIAYSVYEHDLGRPDDSKDNYTGSYAAKTWAESRLSTSIYDKKIRTTLFLVDLGLNDKGQKVAGYGKGTGRKHHRRVKMGIE